MKQLLKSIRIFYPINRLIAIFTRGFIGVSGKTQKKMLKHWPINGQFRVQLPNGKSFRWFSRGDDYISGFLYWSDVMAYEKSARAWMLFSQHAKNVADLGANTGLYSVLSAVENPNCKIFAFEPVPRIAKRLHKQVSINKASNITVETLMVSNQNGEATFYVPNETEIPLAGSAEKGWVSKVDEVKVHSTTLDDYYHSRGLSDPNLIKIDCEFHEFEVLSGMKRIMAHSKPAILIEILMPDADGVKGHFESSKHLQVQQLVLACGYSIYLIHDNAAVRLDAFENNPDDRNFMLLPFKTANTFLPLEELVAQWAQWKNRAQKD